MKKLLLTTAVAFSILPALAQRTLSDIANSAKFGGYFTGMYTASEDKSVDKGFGMRYLRLYLDGTMFDDFKYRFQVEMSGEPGVDKGPRLLDAYGEWRKYKGFQVRFGQMKRIFTFENPFNPWNVGFGAYSQAVSQLAGFNDRTGEHSSGGRDAGLVIQGDLFPIRKRAFLHYQIGVYNGQGINHREVKDAPEQAGRNKDVIGGLWINPIDGLSVGAFGWTGKYYNSADNATYSRNRLAYGFKYEGEWAFRGEYVTSQGKGHNCLTDHADGWYLLAGAPIGKKAYVYGKWDVYRKEKSRETQTTLWCLSGEYYFWKNLKLQANYYFTDKEKGVAGTGERFYNTAEVQLYVRF